MLVRLLTGLIALLLLSVVALYIIVIPNVRDDQVTGDEKSEEIKQTQSKQGAITRMQNNKWIYLGFKADSIGEVLTNFQQVYKTKMDSMDLVFETVFYKMERMDDRLTKKDEELETSIEDLESSFNSFKRKTDRELRKIKKTASDLKSDVEANTEKLNRIKPDAIYTDEELLEMQEDQNNQ